VRCRPRATVPPAGPLKWLCLCAIVVLCGCATRPAWLDDPQAATLRYWYDQPASVRVYADDYRDLPGQHDKLVAIEMIEAVGHDYLPEFFENVARLLKPGGAACLQAITMPDDRYDAYLRSTDFIRRYVFPGSCCPAMKAIRAASAPAGFTIVSDDILTPHYAETLRRWRTNFNDNLESARALGYPERFIRLWDYYLAYCEAGFAEDYIAVRQLTLTTAPVAPVPTVTIPAREKALA